MSKTSTSLIILCSLLAVAIAAENYLDNYFGDDVEDKAAENIRELLNSRELFNRLLMRKAELNGPNMVGMPAYEHLMIRKSQRSPSLRLRFGRSGPPVPSGILSRPRDEAAAIDDN